MHLSRNRQLLFHLIGWVLFLSLVLGFVFSNGNEEKSINGSFLLSVSQFGALYAVVFYLNSEVLLPKLWFRKQYGVYVLVAVGLLAIVGYMKPYDRFLNDRSDGYGPPGLNRSFPPPENRAAPLSPNRNEPPQDNRGGPGIDIVGIVLFAMTWSMSSALVIIRQWRDTEQRAARAEADKAMAELSFLKAQINPHFLFNTLNNIYAMAVTQRSNTADAVMKLSNILRYVTDDVSQHWVPLQSEVDCIHDFVDLQRMRLGTNTSVDFSVNGSPEDHKIAPLILMTFIENVFKYGVSNHEPAKILIQISATGNGIRFFSQNQNFDSAAKLERQGIGIDNTQKRLQHSYPGKHDLQIRNENGLFTVDLTLEA